MRLKQSILTHRRWHSDKKYLESHPDWKIVKTENTAGAAKKVHEEMNPVTGSNCEPGGRRALRTFCNGREYLLQ